MVQTGFRAHHYFFQQTIDQSEADIILSLGSGYPGELSYKLYERRAKIRTVFKVKLAGFGHDNNLVQDLDGACSNYKLALKFLEIATKLSTDKKKMLQAEIMKTLTFLANTPESVRTKLAKEAAATQEKPSNPQVCHQYDGCYNGRTAQEDFLTDPMAVKQAWVKQFGNG